MNFHAHIIPFDPELSTNSYPMSSRKAFMRLDAARCPALPGRARRSSWKLWMHSGDIHMFPTNRHPEHKSCSQHSARCPALPGRAVVRATALGEQRAKRALGRSPTSPKGEPLVLRPGQAYQKTLLFYLYCFFLSAVIYKGGPLLGALLVANVQGTLDPGRQSMSPGLAGCCFSFELVGS